MGFGFRCGFLGLLHMEIVQERLEREYDLDLIITAPTVVYKAMLTDGEEVTVDNPCLLPDAARREYISEPYVRSAPPLHSPPPCVVCLAVAEQGAVFVCCVREDCCAWASMLSLVSPRWVCSCLEESTDRQTDRAPASDGALLCSVCLSLVQKRADLTEADEGQSGPAYKQCSSMPDIAFWNHPCQTVGMLCSVSMISRKWCYILASELGVQGPSGRGGGSAVRRIVCVSFDVNAGPAIP